MNDSVREELKDKILFAPKPRKFEVKQNPPLFERSNMPMMTKPKTEPVSTPQIAVNHNTSEIAAKATSPTLVEFQNKNATLPDWRLQLQNAVRKRVENVSSNAPVETKPAMAVNRVRLKTSGANALKAEYFEEDPVVPNENQTLANALRRIEDSRKRFLETEITETAPKAQSAQSKNYPFYIAAKNAEMMPKPAEMKTPFSSPGTPKFEDLPVIEKKDLDTNKLSPLPNSAIISINLDKV